MAAIAGVVVGALAFAGASGASVDADRPMAGDHVVVEEVLAEQPTDRAGRPIGPKVTVPPDAHRYGSARLASAGRATPRTLRASASGCKTVWAARIGRSFLFGTTLWKYTQEKRFCWSFPRLTSVNTNAYPCCTDPTWFYTGAIGSNGWFFSWAGSANGGHYSFRQGRFEQRVLGKVLDSAQPWVKLWVHGDGTWQYDTGA